MQVMAEDLNPEKMREENQDGEGLSGLTIKDFEERWWNKLHVCVLIKSTVLSNDKDTETGWWSTPRTFTIQMYVYSDAGFNVLV